MIELDKNISMRQAEEDALRALMTEILRDAMICLEVGTWKGNSASIIAPVIKPRGGHLFCVDHWQGSDGLQREANERDILAVFRNNMRELGVNDCVHILIMSSLEAAGIIRDGYLDFVFIDGNHAYSHIKEDILAWIPKLKETGVLSGHDYLNKKNYGHEGVRKAVDEILGDNVKILEGTSIWVRKW